MVEANTEETFVKIEVRNPRTHISREKALYTDYEIVVKTNDIAFACTESSVRRRYSDFQWLRTRLITLYKLVTSPPELPPKRLFGRFQRQFLKRRQAGLQTFLLRVIEDNQYLSDVAIHLFLQSSLPVKEIERYLDGIVSDCDIMETLQSPGKGRQSGLSRSMAEIPLEIEPYMEHDSGFCYSTTSSINEFLHTPITKCREDWRYFVSMPANLDKVNADERNETSQQDVHRAQLHQLDSGSGTMNESRQSLHRTARSSESDCDFVCSHEYEADDESDCCFAEGSDETTLHFEFSQVLSIDQALDILRFRPTISERIRMSEETDDEEFHESEYDVIDSESEDHERKSRRKSSSLSKRKFSRSLSDAKLKRKTSRSSMQDMREPTKKGTFKSMPNIRVFPPKKLKHAGGLNFKTLASHQEDPELGRVAAKAEGFTTSSSLSKYKSDDADESFVPNSELDCYSTWNSPPKMLNANVDSSEVEASMEHHLELKPRATARSLFKRIISKREHTLHGGYGLHDGYVIDDERAPVISGRFRVSVIREEENSSRRGSASSNEMTLKRSPFKENLNKNCLITDGSANKKPSLQNLSNLYQTDNLVTNAATNLSVSRVADVTSSPLLVTEVSDSEKSVPFLEIEEEANIIEDGLHDWGSLSKPSKEVPTLPSLVKDALNDEGNVGSARLGNVSDVRSEKESCATQIMEEGNVNIELQTSTTIAADSGGCSETVIERLSRNDNEHARHAESCDFMQSAGSFFKELSTTDKLYNVLSINGNIYNDHSLLSIAKVRAVSPISAVLKTYDVIPDLVEDYETLSQKRE